jgi:hypothetical protein
MIFYLFAGLFPGIYRIRGERKNMERNPKINQIFSDCLKNGGGSIGSWEGQFSNI